MGELIASQATLLKTTKVQVYNAVWRWQPYSSQICFPDIAEYFKRLRSDSSCAQDEVEVTEFQEDVVMVEEPLQ